MDWVLLILLFLHIMGAILAFGPGFTLHDPRPDGRR